MRQLQWFSAEQPGPLNPSQLTFAGLMNYWQVQFPDDICCATELPFPLVRPKLPARDGAHDDGQNIQWQSLLAGDPHAPLSLNIPGFKATLENLWPLRSVVIH